MFTNKDGPLELSDPFDLLRVVFDVIDRFAPNTPWWRGHRKSTWQLTPYVYREDRERLAEQDCGLHFCLKAPAILPDYPDSDIKRLFLMQHSGLPTRLLDWTESPLIAMFFAVSKDTPEPATLWALNALKMSKLMQSQIGLALPQNPLVAKIARAAFDSGMESPDKIVAVVPEYLDYRMLSQRSCFTIHGTKEPIENSVNAEEFLIKVDIPVDQKKEIRNVLTKMAIRRSHIFPDIENLAQELKSDFYKDAS